MLSFEKRGSIVKHLDHAAANELVRILRDMARVNSKFVYTCQITPKRGKPEKPVAMNVLTKNTDIEFVSDGRRQYLEIGVTARKMASVPITRRGFVPTVSQTREEFAAQYEVQGNVVRFLGEGVNTTVEMTFTFS